MPNILDRTSSSPKGFRPRTVEEFFALQLARKLADTENLRYYQTLVEQYPRELILQAYRRAEKKRGNATDLCDRFRVELKKLAENQ
jgi:hypothetical protein